MMIQGQLSCVTLKRGRFLTNKKRRNKKPFNQCTEWGRNL